MWSSNGITFVWCLMLFGVAFGTPVAKTEGDAPKPDPIILEIDVPAEQNAKPTDTAKPNELATDPKPAEAKPTEETKPSDSLGPVTTTTIFESIPMSLTPARPQMLVDQRQEGKYNIRADLDNFVILVVPSTGNSLLDLLKRSSQRQQQQQHQQQQHNKRVHNTKHHKKYQSVAAVAAKPSEGKKGGSRLDYLNGDGSDANQAGIEAFIEGRTPYHVDISSEEVIQPAAAYGVRSLNGASIADLPLANIDENTASTSSSSSSSSSSADSSDGTIILSALSGKSSESQPNGRNFETSPPRLSKSIIFDGYGGSNPFANFNTVILTRPNNFHNANHHASQHLNNNDNNNNKDSFSKINQNYYNNYFSRKPSVQIVDINGMVGHDHGNENANANDNERNNANLIQHTPSTSPNTELTDLTDSKTSFNSLNVGNIDRLALAGDDSSTKADSDLANAQWELTLLGAEEQCGPDRRRDSYGVCQFVPADYATT